MALHWRYVVQPDGSFTRIANINGSLDNLTDEQLAQFANPDNQPEEAPIPPCSRCSGTLLLAWHGPLTTGEWMELCPACDADRPAARAFIRWYRNPDRTAGELPRLFDDWETETMEHKGWVRIP